MPPRRLPAVAADPAIVHAAYVQAGSVRKAADLLGIAKSVVSDLLLGKSKQMSETTAERVGRTVANAPREEKRQLVGTANVLRERARGGDPGALARERETLRTQTPQERRAVVRQQEQRQTAAAAEYSRYLSSQRERTRSPDRRQQPGPFQGAPSLFSELREQE